MSDAEEHSHGIFFIITQWLLGNHHAGGWLYCSIGIVNQKKHNYRSYYIVETCFNINF